MLKLLRPLVLCLLAARPAAAAQRVLVAPFSGVISPVAAEFMAGAVARAEAGGYGTLVLELDTPGGLDASMRLIVKAVMSSKVPVIVYVFPPGGRAASAGVFIAMAAHVAAMAPGTNIGAAHPVTIPASLPSALKEKDKEKPDEVMEGKLVNDAAAYVRSIAHARERNEDWVAAAVTKSLSIPAQEALKLKVVDLEEASLEDLLKAVDGRKLPGFKTPLRTAGAEVDFCEMTRRQRWLAALSDPNVAMILMSLGAGGLFIELYSPGLILPGIVGAVSLICAFYSFQTLSASYAGVLLVLLGLLFFLLEVKIASYGMLAVGGAAATMLGMLMLFRGRGAGGLEVSPGVITEVIGGMMGLAAVAAALVARSCRRRVKTGPDAMSGARGRAATALSPAGKVRLQGEIWDAVSIGGRVEEGAEVLVAAVDGLTLKVRAATAPR